MTPADALGRQCRPLINVCDRYDMVNELTRYLYSSNMLRYIEGYAQKVRLACCPPAAALRTQGPQCRAWHKGRHTFLERASAKYSSCCRNWRQLRLLCSCDDNACLLANTTAMQVSPAKAPQVVGALLDVEAPDDFITNLILSIRSLIPVEALCAEVR